MANDIDKKKASSSIMDFTDGDMESMMMMMVMMIMMTSLISPLAQQVNSQGAAQAQAIAAQTFVGNEDPRNIHATSFLSWINLIYDYPYQPWISAFIINDGPAPVEIGIDFPDDRFTVNPGETRTIVRSGAEERIKIMYFQCTAGLTANLRVTGVY